MKSRDYNMGSIIKLLILLTHDFSNLRINKLLYFIQGAFIIEYGETCFENKICAWQFGPSIPEVYDAIKNNNIDKLNDSNKPDINDNEKDKSLIEKVVKGFENKTSWELVDITYKQDPFVDAYDLEYNTEITPESMKNFYDNVEITPQNMKEFDRQY